jgi:hypothetical protein
LVGRRRFDRRSCDRRAKIARFIETINNGGPFSRGDVKKCSICTLFQSHEALESAGRPVRQRDIQVAGGDQFVEGAAHRRSSSLRLSACAFAQQLDDLGDARPLPRGEPVGDLLRHRRQIPRCGLLLARPPHPISLAFPCAKESLHHHLLPIDAGYGPYPEPDLLVEGELHAVPECRGGPSGAFGDDVFDLVVNFDL